MLGRWRFTLDFLERSSSDRGAFFVAISSTAVDEQADIVGVEVSEVRNKSYVR